jgi:ribosomal-protein-serine acetyltransferase
MPVKVICKAGEDLELRTLHRGLAARIFQTVDAERQHLGKWLPWVQSTQGMADSVKFLQNAREMFLRGEGVHGAIWDQDQFVGMMALRITSRADRTGHVGYWLSSRAQGRGIVSRLLGEFVAYCFEDWKLHRLELHCAVANERSCRVAERIGFQCEGVLREARLVNGEFLDMKLFSLLRHEWERGRAGAAAAPSRSRTRR